MSSSLPPCSSTCRLGCDGGHDPDPVCPQEPIEIAVASGRRVGRTRGVQVQRLSGLASFAESNGRPPRLRLEDAVLLTASAAPREDAAVAVLADACQEGRTTADRLAAALTKHPRLRHRRLLSAVLGDVRAGVRSPLERRYLVHVERAHALPRASRQSRAAGPVFRDVRYAGQHLVVELDGRLAHDRTQARWADLDRDLAAAATGDVTVRITWGQVLEPCRAAAAVARVLINRGWSGRPVGCGPDCPAANIGDLPAPGAGRSPSSTD